ncbi:MAG: hypothetical protein ABSF94_00200 [Steroidobacteraceae bacterium]|jgi:predicted AlkP superfamily pyrophosphatase or phosphodiesterase
MGISNNQLFDPQRRFADPSLWYAGQILRRRRPAFMAIHLSSLDSAQHAHGPFSTALTAMAEPLDLR